MRRLTVIGFALALGFIAYAGAPASACGSSCVTDEDYDYYYRPAYRTYPRQVYDYYIIVPNGPPGSGYRLVRTLPPSVGLFGPQVYYYGRRPTYEYVPSYRRRHHHHRHYHRHHRHYDERW